MLLRNFTLLLLSLSFANAFSQDSGLLDKSSLPQADMYDATSVVDSTYGIVMYEKLNKSAGGDSVRKKHGRPANGWIEDFYKSGALLHKGFYFEGQLKVYKNYYENGKLERNFKAIDDYKSNAKLYYSNGNLKYDADFKDGLEIKTVQYYENGKLEFVEEMDKDGGFFSKRETYYETGVLEKQIELNSKKKMMFACKEFFENAMLKEEGMLFYNEVMSDYQKDGVWKIYDTTGKQVGEQVYIKGELNQDKKL